MGGAVICRAAFHFQPFPAMARLHIIIGYASRSNDAEPHVLHAGRDADAAIAQRQQALRPGGWCRVEHIDGARGLVKHNSDASATRPQTAAEQAAAEKAAAEQAAAEKAAAEKAAAEQAAAEQAAAEKAAAEKAAAEQAAAEQAAKGKAKN